MFTVYFYNFGMPDFGVSSLVGIIDGVKVLAFAVRQGRVAVHCHAGLGRTGRNMLHTLPPRTQIQTPGFTCYDLTCILLVVAGQQVC